MAFGGTGADREAVTRSVLLPDGRRIAYAEYGSPHGRTVLYCHGFPGSREEARLLLPAIRDLGVRVLAPDRPGYGGSDPKRGRRLSDFARDAIALLDTLGLGSVAVMGVSGGGPYALSLLAAYPERITRLALVGALGPPEAIAACHRDFVPFVARAWRLAQTMRALLAPVTVWPLVRLLRLRGRLGDVRFLAGADEAVLADARVREVLIGSQREGLRQGGWGAAQDLVLYLRPWDFRVTQTSPPVTLWAGEDDRVVPVAMVYELGRLLPQAGLRVIPGEGHYSLPVHYARAILADLVGAA